MRVGRMLGGLWTCADCGALVDDQEAHTRFHSIGDAQAWALSVLVGRHLSAMVHDAYDVKERIDSRRFDSWSAEALAEVTREHEPPGE